MTLTDKSSICAILFSILFFFFFFDFYLNSRLAGKLYINSSYSGLFRNIELCGHKDSVFDQWEELYVLSFFFFVLLFSPSLE